MSTAPNPQPVPSKPAPTPAPTPAMRYKLIAVFGGVIVPWMIAALLCYRYTADEGNILSGVFGALNTLFAGLAFGGVLLALYFQSQQLKMQSHELELQRKELKLTRREMRRSAKAQEESEAALQMQSETMMDTAMLSALSGLREFHEKRQELGTSQQIEETKNILGNIVTQTQTTLERIYRRSGQGDVRLNTLDLRQSLADFVRKQQANWTNARGNKPEWLARNVAQHILFEAVKSLIHLRKQTDNMQVKQRLAAAIAEFQKLQQHPSNDMEGLFSMGQHRTAELWQVVELLQQQTAPPSQ